MFKSGPIKLALGMLSIATGAVAQNATLPSGPANPAIVTVDFNGAVLATAEAKRDLGSLQAKFAPRESELQKLNDAIEVAKRQLNDPAAKLSDGERVAKTQDLNNKEKQLAREAEDFRNDSQAESQQVFERIAQKFLGLLHDYSQQHGYAAVIERGTDSAPIVWYAAANIDITKQIARAYDLKFGAGASNLPVKPPEDGAAKPQAQKPSR